ncbi:MBL fold metallo-hydrolase [Fodinibius saliphilus]|uniref:MBL fold metallo-hydrolase n=1 Tax=Fodinibius saliphilus TaxID=1920650 RepID=UPI001108B3A6|nr:MBL fold metallo-hydrolase [Fodinibius saliphilus]
MNITKAEYHGILLPNLNIGFDYSGTETQHTFISHAHADHMPRNRNSNVYCTKNTLKLMQRRGFKGEATVLDFNEPFDTDRARITLFPAGHILGSAMVYVESEEGTVLYTGDYRTPPSPASEGFVMPRKVDHLITEATFSLPIYRWDSHQELGNKIRTFAAETLADNHTPVFLAYNLGKAQEVMHFLSPLNHPVQIHGAGYKMCAVYEEAGIDLGRYSTYNRESCEGNILITTNSALNNGFASNVRKKRIAYCSGWASREATRSQLTVHKLIPLSDHLDFFELIQLCEELRPKKVHITHTPNADVVRHYLKQRDINSRFLDL